MHINTEEGARRRVHHMHKAGLSAAEKVRKRHALHYTCNTPVAWAERRESEGSQGRGASQQDENHDVDCWV
jgi:hypothetical protein